MEWLADPQIWISFLTLTAGRATKESTANRFDSGPGHAGGFVVFHQVGDGVDRDFGRLWRMV